MTRQYTRHKDPEYKYKDFVCIKLLIPTELHADILKEQEALRTKGRKHNIGEVAIKLIRESLSKA